MFVNNNNRTAYSSVLLLNLLPCYMYVFRNSLHASVGGDPEAYSSRCVFVSESFRKIDLCLSPQLMKIKRIKHVMQAYHLEIELVNFGVRVPL